MSAPAEPSLSEVRALARDFDVVPLHETWIADTETPVSAFLKLRAGDGGAGAGSFLLESAEQGRVGRYSFVGVAPRSVLRWSASDGGDPYALAQAELARFRAPPVVPGLELPFAGGAFGMFAYDLVRTVEPLGAPNRDELGLPDLALMFTDALLVFDHLRHTITAIANVYAADGIERSHARASEQIADIRRRLAGPVPPPGHAAAPGREAPALQPNMSREQFESMVSRIVRYIHAGDAFQVVPSQRFSGPVPVTGLSI